MNFSEYRNELLAWLLVISLLYQWAISYFTDHNRVFRIIIEDSFIEIYCRDAKRIGNMYLWLNLRIIFLDSFNRLGKDSVPLREVVTTGRVAIKSGKLRVADQDALLCLLNELEEKLLREFHLLGVDELDILITPALMYETISYVLDINGG